MVGNRVTYRDQMIIQFKPGHARHPHVGDQAGCLPDTVGAKKIVSALECFRREADCSDQVQGCIAGRQIIINNRNHRSLWHVVQSPIPKLKTSVMQPPKPLGTGRISTHMRKEFLRVGGTRIARKD